MDEYFNHLATLPSHVAFIQGKPASDLRKKEGEDNILFRPVVQIALAEAIGKLAGPRRVSQECLRRTRTPGKARPPQAYATDIPLVRRTVRSQRQHAAPQKE